ncbi:MAG: NDP-hexose 4-ketoreductase, partial [Coriobacteriia bacterium]
TLSEAARDKLAESGFDSTLGARPLRRAIQRMIEDPLSEQILAGQWHAGDTIEAHVEGEEIVFRKSDTPPVEIRVPALPAAEAAEPAMPRRASRKGSGGAMGGAAGG